LGGKKRKIGEDAHGKVPKGRARCDKGPKLIVGKNGKKKKKKKRNEAKRVKAQ